MLQRGILVEGALVVLHTYHWGQAPLIGFLIKTVFCIGERITISRSRQNRDVRDRKRSGSGLKMGAGPILFK